MSRIQNILDKAERDGTVRRVRTPADSVAAAGLGAGNGTPADATPAAVMAVVPRDVVESAAAAARPPAAPPARVAQEVRLAPTMVAALAPDAVAAEQYRALRTRVVHVDKGAPVHLLLVTSPGRGDGKSVTAANLSLAMAQEDQQRIAVIDANLRDSELHRLFGIPAAPGLADVLVGRVPLEDALVTIEEHQITVLPAGDPPWHPAELLGTMAMRRTLDVLRSRFDRVVIDAPAAAPLADIGILEPLVDSVLLVVRAGITSKPAVGDAIAAIDPTKLVGVVLNDAAE